MSGIPLCAAAPAAVFQMSRLGLLFCVPYAVFIAACVGVVILGDGDHVSRSFLLQMPIAGQLALTEWLGLGRALEFIAWPDAYGLFMTPAFILLYAGGALLERALARRRGLAPACASLAAPSPENARLR